MPHKRTLLEAAAGKLILAIQKEWGEETGESWSAKSEQVLDMSHDLLQAAKTGSIKEILGGGTVAEFLGKQWVDAHPEVWPYVQVLDNLAVEKHDD